jgi:uncharacterized protein YjbI with pentapeptide repeats
MAAISFLPVGAGLALNWGSIAPKTSGRSPWFPYCHDVGARALLSCDPGKQPNAAELKALSEKQSKWLAMSSDQKSKTEDELRANLCGAWLTIEDSSDSSGFAVNGQLASNLNLSEADLSRSQITITRSRPSHSIEYRSLDLSKTNLYCAKVAGQLVGINLTGANLSYADLRGVVLQDSDLKGARFEDADLTDVTFGPNRSLPDASAFATARNWFSVTYPTNEPETLFQIREDLKKAGLRGPENQITYAIRKTEELRTNLLERTFSFVLFDLTCQFGMAPGRPLKILCYAFLSFALLYIFAQKWPGPTGGIWAQWSEHRIQLNQGKTSPQRLSNGFPPSKFSRTWLGRKTRRFGASCLGLALYFSLISALRIGWHDLNLGTWIDRLLPREYTLRPTGWVKTLSGFQALLSVYLLALWILTYFGTPFE